MKIKTLLLVLFFITTTGAFAQSLITGSVVDEGNLPLPGAEVTVNGKNAYAVTDFDGNFSLQAAQGDVLTIRYLGFKTKEVTIGKETTITVVLEADASELDEVVVIGYGTQKKSDLTGAITVIKSDDITKTPAANAVQSLQGKVAGVQIVSAGSPGDSPTVKLRGLGTMAGTDSPLYVVDGMFYTNIDFLNPNDIKSFNVLKDASSAAIYGVRAAAGVIIIETKSGGYDKKPVFTYDGYAGYQVAQNVLKMANAEQFVTMAYESGSQTDINNVLAAMQRYGRSRVNPNIPDVNTDWYKEILRPALIQSHAIGVEGGSKTVSYSVGANYFNQEGILDHSKNEYERFNLRSKLDIKVSDRFNIGTNTVFSNATKYSPQNSAWNQAYFAVPIIPVYDELNTDAYPERFSNAQLVGYRNTQNPFPTLKYNESQLKIRKLLTSMYAKYDIIPEKLSVKSSYYLDFSDLDERYVYLDYDLGNNITRSQSSINKARNTYYNQIWDNLLTYTDTFGDHNLTAMLGSSYKDEATHSLSATGQDINGIAYSQNWYLNNADPSSFANAVSDSGSRVYSMSYFGRVQYNFKDKYLLYATMRADASSKYTQDPWGYFPSVGLGWVLTEESFMKDNGVFDFLKLRASWGELGNDQVPNYAGSNTITVVSTAIDDTLTDGTVSSSNYADLRWERIEEKNFGISAQTLSNRLSVEADYYIRDTKDAIIPVYQPIVSNYVNRNAGSIRNQGLEVSLAWDQKISDNFSYTISANLTTLKNKVTALSDGATYIDGGSAEFRQRSIIGESINAFYGYEIEGVYQNAAQVSADPIAVDNGLEPGDFMYKDQNNDGVINDDDRVVLGSYLPSFMYGGNFGINYKAFSVSVGIYGQSGNKILNRKRGEVIWTPDQNMDADLAINRWHGEGTTNSYPSSAGLRKGWNQKMSNFFVEDGDFFRIQNVQLAYNLKGELLGVGMPDIKVMLTAERPFTSFGYNGFNPEVANGVDTQTYPIPAIYTLGFNVKF